MRAAAWRSLRHAWPRVILAIAGVAALVESFLVRPRAGNYGTSLLYVGAALVALVAVEKRLIRAKAGPFEAELEPSSSDAPSAIEIAAEIDTGDAGADPDVEEVARFLAGQLALEALLDEVPPECGQAEFRLYLPDDTTGVLLDVFDVADPNALTSWLPGRGATGVAFLRGEFVAATGDDAHNTAYGLTEAQQAHFSDLTGVAAVPVSNAQNTVLGVLSACTREHEPKLDSGSAKDAMLLKALSISRVLIDLLRWFADDE